ncbi:MAG: hypothetical protein A2X61_15365 [Ignavibacteria bacterium GWB2_35_12]|nr:MAG: hypothetical protein A2X61_15365 [Ignavibacteria bacterium GWB2_35_12]OGU92290.1 MAG: hypothetical protein A2220_00645 [Ignavibacteria bacterium RIFOXYA2_FULL_35_10]
MTYEAMMKYMNNCSIYAVCGRPILHSKSPQIFRVLFDSLNFPACYTRIASDNPQEILSIADELGISGLNVTAPFKSDMFKLMDNCDDGSKNIAAVNTILFRKVNPPESPFEKGGKFGYNTDIYGVVETLKLNGIDFNNKICLIIGYGNAASAAVYGIKKEWNNVKIFVTGRTKEKVEEFTKRFESESIIPLNPPLIKGENSVPYLIISTIPRNAFLDINEYLESCEYFLDAAYPDSLMSIEAKKFNCKMIPGEEWLINQALASFKIFTGNEILRSTQNDKGKWILNQVRNDKKNDKKNILLTGFSGSGKTSIGKMLAGKLGYLYFDTDKLIEEYENLSINEVFKQKGEEYFRNIEKAILEKVCNLNRAVISCGGGTLCSVEPNNEDKIIPLNPPLIKGENLVVWLHTPIEKCLKRIDVKYKPMLYSRSMEEIEQLYNERKYLYCLSSDLLVANTNEPSRAVENIIYEMKMIKENAEFEKRIKNVILNSVQNPKVQ